MIWCCLTGQKVVKDFEKFVVRFDTGDKPETAVDDVTPADADKRNRGRRETDAAVNEAAVLYALGMWGTPEAASGDDLDLTRPDAARNAGRRPRRKRR